ncbi:MAG: GNAT family N-acetyltransferase [Cyanobacteria bacterium P01_A01_bin.135]
MLPQTERLVLRQMSLADTNELLAVFSDEETMQFYPAPFDRQMTQAWIERNRRRYIQDGFGLWALILKQTGDVIGDCGLVCQAVEGKEAVEIGYHIRRDLWGQGLAGEAAQACRDYGFNQLDLNHLVSLIHPNNTASRRVAEKIGMALVEETVWRGNRTCLYAIERSDTEKVIHSSSNSP